MTPSTPIHPSAFLVSRFSSPADSANGVPGTTIECRWDRFRSVRASEGADAMTAARKHDPDSGSREEKPAETIGYTTSYRQESPDIEAESVVKVQEARGPE